MEGMCRIPMKARVEVVNGKAVMVSAEWEDVQAEAIAAFLVDKLGPGFWEREAENRRPLAAGSVK